MCRISLDGYNVDSYLTDVNFEGHGNPEFAPAQQSHHTPWVHREDHLDPTWDMGESAATYPHIGGYEILSGSVKSWNESWRILPPLSVESVSSLPSD